MVNQRHLHTRPQRGLSRGEHQSLAEHSDLVLDHLAPLEAGTNSQGRRRRPYRLASAGPVLLGRGRRTGEVPRAELAAAAHAVAVGGARLAQVEDAYGPHAVDGTGPGLDNGVAAGVVHDGCGRAAVVFRPGYVDYGLRVEPEELAGRLDSSVHGPLGFILQFVYAEEVGGLPDLDDLGWGGAEAVCFCPKFGVSTLKTSVW